MNTKRKNFFLVDNSIFTYRLKPRDIAVYCCICMHINTETGVAFPSRRRIARECGIEKPETVDQAIKVLCENGLIQKHHQYSEDGGYKSNIYTLGSR